MPGRNSIVLALAWLSFVSSARAQQVSFEDLKGRTIEVTTVQLRHIRTIGGEAQQRTTHFMKTVVAPDGKILHSHTLNHETLSGPARPGSMTHSGAFTLEKPQKFRDGTAVFIFSEGSLVRLRTIDTGGQRWTVAFARDGDKFTCKADGGFAREDGRGAIQSTSSLTGNPVVILSVKPVSSSCRVRP
jgi:hypothetical protein